MRGGVGETTNRLESRDLTIPSADGDDSETMDLREKRGRGGKRQFSVQALRGPGKGVDTWQWYIGGSQN